MWKGDDLMKCELKKLLAVAVGIGILSAPVYAADAEAEAEATVEAAAAAAVDSDATTPPEETDPKDVKNKLLKLDTLENAFFTALQKRDLYRRFIVQEKAKLEKTEDEDEKLELQKQITAATTNLKTYANAMDIVFGVGRRWRTYEYNRATSTIYLVVGTAEQAFARGVRTRDLLQQYVQQQTALSEAEQDEDKKKEIDGRIAVATGQWQAVSASLQLIFNVTPQRSYQYNPQNSTLYLKVSDREVEKLQAQAAELQEKREEEAAEAEAGGDGN